MKKRGLTKDKLSVSINKEILQKFNDHCKANSINKSNLIEKFIKKFLEDKK